MKLQVRVSEPKHLANSLTPMQFDVELPSQVMPAVNQFVDYVKQLGYKATGVSWMALDDPRTFGFLTLETESSEVVEETYTASSEVWATIREAVEVAIGELEYRDPARAKAFERALYEIQQP